MNYLLTIEYEGTRYEGWQRQKKTTQTIQGKLEQVLSRMTEKEIEIDGAGRTDAGVHAKNQTASVHLAKKWDPKEILQYMNQYLPEDICVKSVEPVSERFHARSGRKENVILTGLERMSRNRCLTGSFGIIWGKRWM